MMAKMLTTERKIEIAEAVMNDPLLGYNKLMLGSRQFAPYTICGTLWDVCVGEDELRQMYHNLFCFARSINIDCKEGDYWFSIERGKARTERIDFLQKYISHLKNEQEQEPPMMGMSY